MTAFASIHLFPHVRHICEDTLDTYFKKSFAPIENKEIINNKMPGSRVYVGGLPYGTRERDLEKFFKGYGRTRDILIKNGYGFVEFEDYRDADDAVYELNGKELLGERVVVEPARGTARGSGGHRDRYNDRYDRRGGGGRYDRHNSSRNNSSRYGPPLRTEYRLIVENLSSRVSWQNCFYTDEVILTSLHANTVIISLT
ncbi:CLUMA_CG019479, isoform B [Clunio marinus]|uniref:CLUMA_CG019479, isoform B n=1 Tax=Clunio marinus TaxID=568069 RepID=A0A1J1J2W3_9DIPT|nr:CLUMA_CG019479, isoform B [Clunio marinus]